MRIGDLARATGTAVETIRFYEREGLLPAAGRGDNNYRQYERAHVERLTLIRTCRGLDMTLEEIGRLLRLRDHPAGTCADVNALLDEHLRHVSQRIRDLRALEESLEALRASCREPGAMAECGILGRLEQQASVVPLAPGKGHVRGAR